MSAMTGMAVAALVAWRLVRALRARRQRPVRVTYPDGRVVRAEPGATLLEVSRAAGIPMRRSAAAGGAAPPAGCMCRGASTRCRRRRRASARCSAASARRSASGSPARQCRAAM